MTTFDEDIRIIVPDGDNGKIKQLRFQCSYESEPSDSTLRQYWDFSVNPHEAYASCLRFVNPSVPLWDKEERRRAYAHQCTMDRIKKEHPRILAFSHRKGGWTGFDWEFNKDIKFHVSSNFGYGSSSYFFLKIYYKDYQLTPYSYYVRYQYADVNEICRYTNSYCVNYDSWRKTMDDAEEFYNAVVHHQDTHVLGWIKGHLEKMLVILDEFIHKEYGYYEGNYVEDMRKKQTETFTGDGWWITKTEKIVGSTDFIDNIRQLPVEVEPEMYIGRLIEINRKFLPLLKEKNASLEEQIQSLQRRIEEESQYDHYPLYKKLYDKYYDKRRWYYSSNKRNMFRTLLGLHHRHEPNYSYRQLKTIVKICLARVESINNLMSKKSDYQRTYDFLKKKEKRLVNTLQSFDLEQATKD